MANVFEARALLEAGDFQQAVAMFGDLLAKDPENQDLIAGFYTASYWQNRQSLLSDATNQELSLLLNEWSRFEKKLAEKKIVITPSVDSGMRVVLVQASKQLRHRFQDGNVGSDDLNMILQLAQSMIRLQDYQNAEDLLSFAIRLEPHRADALLMSGECKAILSQAQADQVKYEDGLGVIRDAFLLKPVPVADITLYRSMPIHEIVAELTFRYSDDSERVKIWLSAEWMASIARFGGLRRLDHDEILQMEDECQRLSRDLPTLDERFREKAIARLSFYLLVLLHSLTHHYQNDQRFNEISNDLHNLRPALLQRFQEDIQV